MLEALEQLCEVIKVEKKEVRIPEGVRVNLNGKVVEVIGPLGKIVRDFSNNPVSIEVLGDNVVVYAVKPKKREKSHVGTVAAHIRNMIRGVTKGFTYKLKIVYAHFPISVKVSGDKVFIENFMGERTPRTARIVGNTKVTVKGDDVIVQGINLEDVSQTAANIEQATKIKERDPRRFLDGIYIYEKVEGLVS
ncbi:MAG: 50S ribosomal protein L6 [Candidatus Bathyarchaeia archaeon]|nr:50S ribosomal protein L6 [Candidatus Bathyarchaeota archaeon]